MVRVILNIGNEPIYDDYPNATDYRINGEWVGLYDSSNIQIGTIDLHSIISICINNK